MPRVTGARDADYEAKRAALLARVRDRLALPDAPHPSFRELADSAGVSQTTLRHYFGTIDGVIAAVFEAHGVAGAPYLQHMALPNGPFALSLARAADFIVAGQRLPATRAIHRIAQSEGVRRDGAGAAFRHHILDASVGAIAVRFEAHMRAGEMRASDARFAAIGFAAPILLAFQHQADLNGATSCPLDLERLVADHVAAFVRAYGLQDRSD